MYPPKILKWKRVMKKNFFRMLYIKSRGDEDIFEKLVVEELAKMKVYMKKRAEKSRRIYSEEENSGGLF